MRSHVPGIDDAVYPALNGNATGDISQTVKPVLIDIVPVGIKVVKNLHGIFAYKRNRVKDRLILVIYDLL